MTDEGAGTPPEYPSPPQPPPLGGSAGGGWETPAAPAPPPPAAAGAGWQAPPAAPPPGAGGGYMPPPAYPYGTPPGPQKTETLAIWSLVLGIVSFIVCPVIAAIAAIITGVKAKNAISRSGNTSGGRGMATAGEILGILNVVFAAIGIVLIVILGAAASKHTTYTDIQTGECFNRVSSSSIFSGYVDRVDCSKAHDLQATGSFQASDPGHYPGANGFQSEASTNCSDDLNSFVTGPKDGLMARFFYPNQSTWDSGTHEILCAVAKDDGSKLTGSLGG